MIQELFVPDSLRGWLDDDVLAGLSVVNSPNDGPETHTWASSP